MFAENLRTYNMENFYLIIVVVLFALAISDLIVGVSNDAVNFLNSAFGSKAAPRWAILTIASLGILVGATFSSGMMEVARKGIFSSRSILLCRNHDHLYCGYANRYYSVGFLQYRRFANINNRIDCFRITGCCCGCGRCQDHELF